MKTWQMAAPGLPALKLETAAIPDPGPFEVLVRIGAVALNFRDRLTLDGLMPNLAFPCDPTSDGAGEVVAAGRQVTRFRVGDRVLGQIITNWIDGPGPGGPPLMLGVNLPGVLREYAVFHQDAVVAAPASLDDVAAATLPGAGLAAWMALAETEHPLAGKTV
jgi:NADPH:quinone reductase-like Zn-dependent oxidoreductase